MTLKQILGNVRAVALEKKPLPVEETVGREALAFLGKASRFRRIPAGRFAAVSSMLYAAVADVAWKARMARMGVRLPGKGEWTCVHLGPGGSIFILASQPSFLYAAWRYFLDSLLDEDASLFRPWVRTMSFDVEKSTFDLLLTQYGRIARGIDREAYIREYARLGFTHIEVNALATPLPYEQGVPLEFYPDFYTYCPALDQFVESRLNRGTYPREYLRANLDLLKDNVRLAVKYGLAPGLLCFEPRSVPETLFQKYPTLRGPRVDHPFRSFKPRYALSLVHPVARKHYAELISNLMREAPELAFMSIWSNDSGSGFEHTKSLYVGRNGGAYMIREWKNDEEIAKAAAANIAGFYRLLKAAAARINPGFRVITRLESFYGERRQLWPLLSDGIDVEINSLLVQGWENNYPHPSYPDVKVLGSGHHNTLWDREKAPMAELAARGSRAFYYHFFNSHGNHEPLLGIPFPWLVHDKLRAFVRLGVKTLAHMGGLHPTDKVPYPVNQDLFREFQFDARLDIEAALLKIARGYAGPKWAKRLVGVWRRIDTAVRRTMPMSLYSGFGSVWNRLLVRPFVPDIDRIPEEERAYYEKVMVSPVHNPNKVDLGKDVLFELISKDYAKKAFTRIDAKVGKPLGAAIDLAGRAKAAAERAGDEQAVRVFRDVHLRALALRCLIESQRNAAVWIYAVHEYGETRSVRVRRRCRALLDDMIGREIANAEDMIRLWNESGIEWMAVSDFGETPFIHGGNFADLLKKKIALMKRHRRDAPFIDPDYMFRVENDPYR
jgi:hypothetical protein